MNESSNAASIPPDDPKRKLALVRPDDKKLRHIALAGDTYTILLTGGDTGGRYCFIDMHIHSGGVPGRFR